jgi:hypothetical protein
VFTCLGCCCRHVCSIQAGPANARFPVVHLWGSAYQMGIAQGLIHGDAVRAFVNQTLAYIVDQASR